MTGTFRGVAKTAPERGALALVERRLRPPGPGEVAVRVLAAGICGTDLEVYEWSPPIARVMDEHLPVVIGHEFAGVVEALGPGVASELLGARVAVESHRPCGSCRNCRGGMGHVCARLEYVGFHFDGGFADRSIVPSSIVYPLPEAIDDVSAAIMEPFGLAVRAVDEGRGSADAHVVITGCGALGIMSALVAQARGARSLILAEQDPVRLELARRLTQHAHPPTVVDVRQDDLAGVVDAVTAGEGADVLIDFTGAQASVDVALQCLAKGGEARLLGIYPPQVTVDLTRAVLHEIVLRPLHGRLLETSWRSSIELLAAGTVDLRPLVTAQYGLDAFEEAFTMARERDGLKVVLRP